MQVVSSTPTAQVARSRGTAPLGVGLLVAVAALLLGILGMHALGLHGVSHGAPAPGVSVVDHRADEGYVTPAECAGEDMVYVSRIREDFTVEHGLSFWVVSDNLRKGAALNAVQIAEEILNRDLLDKARTGAART